MARPAEVTAATRRETTEHYPCFDGLRAVAALAVLMHHAAIETAFNLKGEVRVPFSRHHVVLGHYFGRMDAGVQIFFLISGFLLYRPFVAAAFDERSPTSARVFFRRRFLRIFPAYWFAFICIALFVGLDQQVGGARTMVEQFFLVHLYDPSNHGARAVSGISQSWTLVVELSFYLFLPLYAYVMRRVGAGADRDRRLRIELAGIAVIYSFTVIVHVFVFWAMADGTLRSLLQYWLPSQFDLFGMGMALAVLRSWQERRSEPVRALEWVGRYDWLWWLCAAATFTLVTFGVGLSPNLTVTWGAKAYAKQFLYGLTALFLVLPAVFGPQHRGIVRRFLRVPPIVYLGMISYGIYLWHQAFIKKVHQWGGWALKPGEPVVKTFRGNFSVHVLVALALSVVAASISWYLVERPCLRRKDRPLFGTRR